jgi:hypothetical protein
MSTPKLEKTKCYKCEESIEAEVGQVHPLCAECEADFDAWFTRTLSELDRK